jgi:PhnB protein
MATQVKAIPDGYHTITPYLAVRGAADAIEFYQRAFGAVENCRMPGPDGRLMHAEIQIGDSRVMLGDEWPEMGGALSPLSRGGTTGGLCLYVPDVDASFDRAVAAGATVKMPVADMFWGDRYGKVVDPFGHEWSLATHKEDLTPEEMMRRGEEAMAQMCQPQEVGATA